MASSERNVDANQRLDTFTQYELLCKKKIEYIKNLVSKNNIFKTREYTVEMDDINSEILKAKD